MAQLVTALTAMPWFAKLRARTQETLCRQLTLELAEPGALLASQVPPPPRPTHTRDSANLVTAEVAEGGTLKRLRG